MKNKRQTVNSFMVNFNHNNGVIEYQLLFSAFADYINSKECEDMSSKMQVAHFLENFLRKENIQNSLTITDVNGLMDSEYIINNINNISIYQNILLLIYEELSSNDSEISELIIKIISNVGIELMKIFSDMSKIDNNQIEENIENNKILIENNFENNENNQSSPDCFNCDKKFICTKDTRDKELIEQLQKEDKENFSNLTKDVKDIFKNKNVTNLDNLNKINFKNTNKIYIKEYLLRKNIIPYKCNICGLDTWQNEPLPLELDIIDEYKTNINNFRFLCPNCYSQSHAQIDDN